MQNIYDNGEKVLGRIYDLKEYICRNCEDYEEIKEIIEELENYDFRIYEKEKDDIIKNVEKESVRLAKEYFGEEIVEIKE